MSFGYREYELRRIDALGIWRARDYRLKMYSVTAGLKPLDPEAFHDGRALALQSLPPVAPEDGRPGAGVLLHHQGYTKNYTVACWWDQENELPVRVFVSAGDGWRTANEHESICVWDLEILWFERDAWVATVLSGAAIEPGVNRYLEMFFAQLDAIPGESLEHGR